LSNGAGAIECGGCDRGNGGGMAAGRTGDTGAAGAAVAGAAAAAAAGGASVRWPYVGASSGRMSRRASSRASRCSSAPIRRRTSA
jgi:hypothetical protein